MRWLFFLVSYHAASAVLFRPNQQSSNNRRNNPNTFGDIVSDLLNDFNLDISFSPNAKQLPNQYMIDNQDTNAMPNNDYFIDESPSSMFTLPSLFSDNIIKYQQTEPLYLTMQSPQTQQSNTYALTNTNKVNGNTFRYTLNTDGNSPQMSQSWSTKKMYICNTPECSNKNGMEMENVLNNLMDNLEGKFTNYMHLIPTAMPGLEELETEESNGVHIDMDSLVNMASKLVKNINKDTNGSLLDYAVNSVNQLLDALNKDSSDDMMDLESESDESEQEREDESDGLEEMNEIGMSDASMGLNMDNNERIFEDETIPNKKEGKDIFFMEMTAIIIFVMICGTFYAGWRFLLDQREKQREMDYLISGNNEL